MKGEQFNEELSPCVRTGASLYDISLSLMDENGCLISPILQWRAASQRRILPFWLNSWWKTRTCKIRSFNLWKIKNRVSRRYPLYPRTSVLSAGRMCRTWRPESPAVIPILPPPPARRGRLTLPLLPSRPTLHQRFPISRRDFRVQTFWKRWNKAKKTELFYGLNEEAYWQLCHFSVRRIQAMRGLLKSRENQANVVIKALRIVFSVRKSALGLYARSV